MSGADGRCRRRTLAARSACAVVALGVLCSSGAVRAHAWEDEWITSISFGPPLEPQGAFVSLRDTWIDIQGLMAEGPGQALPLAERDEDGKRIAHEYAAGWAERYVKAQWLPADLADYMQPRARWFRPKCLVKPGLAAEPVWIEAAPLIGGPESEDAYVAHYMCEVTDSEGADHDVECQIVFSPGYLVIGFRGLGDVAGRELDLRQSLEVQMEMVIERSRAFLWDDRDWRDTGGGHGFTFRQGRATSIMSGWTDGSQTVFGMFLPLPGCGIPMAPTVSCTHPDYPWRPYKSPRRAAPDAPWEDLGDDEGHLGWRGGNYRVDAGRGAALAETVSQCGLPTEAGAKWFVPEAHKAVRPLRPEEPSAGELRKAVRMIWDGGPAADELRKPAPADTARAEPLLRTILRKRYLPEDLTGWLHEARDDDGKRVIVYQCGLPRPEYLQATISAESATVTIVRADTPSRPWADERRAHVLANGPGLAYFRRPWEVFIIPVRIDQQQGQAVSGVLDPGNRRLSAAPDSPLVTSQWWGNIRFWWSLEVQHYRFPLPFLETE